MDAEAVHVTKGARNSKACHCPKKSVERARLLAEKVPRCVMRSGCLRNLVVRAWLHRMNQVWEADRVLNKEYRNIVADNIFVLIDQQLSSFAVMLTDP
jgi:hypothetical protein